MAKPIEPTPVLRGADAERFLKEMLHEQEFPSKCRVETLKSAAESFDYFEKMLNLNSNEK